MVLKDEPALGDELVARTRPRRRDGAKRGRMALDFVARPTSRRVLVTLLAPVRIEQRAEASFWGEDAVEHRAAAIELRALGDGQAAQRFTRLRRSTSTRGGGPHR
jgi:hypothetical protein